MAEPTALEQQGRAMVQRLTKLRHAPTRELTDEELDEALERGLVDEVLYAADVSRRRQEMLRSYE